MSFSLDRTRSFLKIEEPNLLSLHRSIHPVVPSAEYCQGRLCDAFICVVQEYALHRVYLALHDQQMKSNRVFISDPVKPDMKKIAALTQEANAFLETIGFEMKPVDLNFSSAVREVIIKDIKVMKEPSLAVQLDAARIAVEMLTAEKEELSRNSSRKLTELKAELDDLTSRLGEAQVVRELPAASTSGSGKDAEALEHELQTVRQELGKVTTMLKNSVEKLKQAKEEVHQARLEQKQTRHEIDLLREKLHAGQREIEKAGKDSDAVRIELNVVMKRYETAEAAHRAETADLTAEIDRLTAELAGSVFTSSAETELLRAALAEANVSLAVEKAKNESALQEMDALERNASIELKLLKNKVDSLTTEKQLLETIASEFKIKARGEIERQQQINQLQRKAAIKKLHALKEEIRQLAEARAVIASPTGVPLAPSGEHHSPFPADNHTEVCFASSPFGSDHTADYVEFVPDSLMKGIPYSSASDVIEVYRSYNTIQAAPYGKQAQRCDGFVCLLTEAGKSQVYVAWMMNSSGEVLVCNPEHAIDGDDTCRSMLREGISYFERIGFLIDTLHLEQDPVLRQIQLDGLGVFCRGEMECAA